MSTPTLSSANPSLRALQDYARGGEEPVSRAPRQTLWTREWWCGAGRMAAAAVIVAGLAISIISLATAGFGGISFAAAATICGLSLVAVNCADRIALICSRLLPRFASGAL